MTARRGPQPPPRTSPRPTALSAVRGNVPARTATRDGHNLTPDAPVSASGDMNWRSALGGEIMPDVPVQPQVRLGLSKETEMVPPGSMVICATSWMLMVLPSEPVAWAENVNVALAFCSFMLKLSQSVACPV
jgi:hypothetical protein